MVLLTSSAVSVIISSSVVCLFTFLLFLSGYVLQQQTVRALQEALRQPRERLPVPTLPPQLQHLDNETASVDIGNQAGEATTLTRETRGSDDAGENRNSIQVPLVVVEGGQAPLAGSQDTSSATSDQVDKKAGLDAPPQRLAYIFALLNPSDLCSTLLFARQQRSSSQLATEPSIVLLYPSTWETDPSPLRASALSLMRDVQALYGLVYHPVQMRGDWDVRPQLLGELQWKHWDYDQALYLRTPGLLLDSKVLDRALGCTNPRSSWTPLNPSFGDNPDVLLLNSKGLQSPRKEMRRLAMSAVTDHTPSPDEGNHNYTEYAARNAAYLLFDEEVEPAQSDNERYRGLLRRFDEGRRSVCAGSGLLE